MIPIYNQPSPNLYTLFLDFIYKKLRYFYRPNPLYSCLIKT